MVHSNSLSCYKQELITESYIPLIISNFSSEGSVKVPHMTDSVDGVLEQSLFKLPQIQFTVYELEPES